MCLLLLNFIEFMNLEQMHRKQKQSQDRTKNDNILYLIMCHMKRVYAPEHMQAVHI